MLSCANKAHFSILWGLTPISGHPPILLQLPEVVGVRHHLSTETVWPPRKQPGIASNFLRFAERSIIFFKKKRAGEKKDNKLLVKPAVEKENMQKHAPKHLQSMLFPSH